MCVCVFVYCKTNSYTYYDPASNCQCGGCSAQNRHFWNFILLLWTEIRQIDVDVDSTIVYICRVMRLFIFRWKYQKFLPFWKYTKLKHIILIEDQVKILLYTLLCTVFFLFFFCNSEASDSFQYKSKCKTEMKKFSPLLVFYQKCSLTRYSMQLCMCVLCKYLVYKMLEISLLLLFFSSLYYSQCTPS